MPDNPKERGPQDRSRVNVEQDHELAYWTKEYGVGADRLKAAVKKVGPMADKVRAELGK